MSRTLDFDYAHVANTAESGTSRNDGAAQRWDEHLPVSMVAAKNRLLVLNGSNENTQILVTDNTGGALTLSQRYLVFPAPDTPLTPLISWPGSGRVYGQGYKWRYRWKNSFTGDVSGLSPSPAFQWNLGVVTAAGQNTYLGQNAYFRIPTNTGDYPTGADSLQLFRNSTNEEDLWYLVDEKKFEGTVTTFTDDNLDDDLFTRETAGLRPNPSYDEGAVFPMVKSFLHSTSRVFLFGIRPMGPYRTGSVTLNLDSNSVASTNSTTYFSRSRIGQRFRVLTGNDVTVYRVVNVSTTTTTNDTLWVTPSIQENSFMTAGVLANAEYEITDDRDARTLWMSEPGLPTNYDSLKQLYVGFDKDDALLHVFAMGGSTFAQTRRHLYQLMNDWSEDPSLSIQIQHVSDEGTTGFRSACMTPFGWVYLHERLGMRVFDGQGPPRPLGGQSPYDEFLAKEQILGRATDAYTATSGLTYVGFDPGFLSEALVTFDDQEKLLHVFYVPIASWSMEEELCFDPLVGVWRGPWRRRCSATGYLRNGDGSEVFTFGDDLGNLWLDQQQDLDLTDGAGASASTTTPNPGIGFVFYHSGAGLDTTAFKQQGWPIHLSAPTHASMQDLRVVWVVDVIDGDYAIVDRRVFSTLGTYTYRIGALQWMLRTAFIDGDEPIQPKKIEAIRLRYRRGAASCSEATGGVLLDGHTDLAQATGESDATFTIDPDSNAFKEWRIQRGSELFALLMYGTNWTGDPQTTQAIMDLDVRGGRGA